MLFVSKPFPAFRVPTSKRQRKRLASALAIVSLCTLSAACSNDDKPIDTNTISSTGQPADNGGNPGGNPFSTASPANPAPATLTIQTPAVPASGADGSASLTSSLTNSSTPSAPLASPVIHTVD
ncbi:hypothetical protein [Paraburkholderia susongensis]|uniref:Uncharacterized protein n=1 Tax=Paraburkholderia susongensis TaxID=1515439 RepID=A0A1X7IDJ5_9BURK|nr:hypothetical protein [Paraburkholderia susongensis]SMG12704.1 hypothetical protein SAMN06265784_101583 [Paraburkholderia susongensis]